MELLNLIYQQNKKFEEHTKVLEEQSKTLKEHSKILEEMNRRIGEQNKRLEEQSKILQELLLEVKSMKRDYNKTIGALGSRWKLRAEKNPLETL